MTALPYGTILRDSDDDSLYMVLGLWSGQPFHSGSDWLRLIVLSSRSEQREVGTLTVAGPDWLKRRAEIVAP